MVFRRFSWFGARRGWCGFRAVPYYIINRDIFQDGKPENPEKKTNTSRLPTVQVRDFADYKENTP